MELTISVPPDSEARLKQRAAASGQDVAAFVSQLVQHFAEPPTALDKLSGPIQDNFIASGMTDDELGEELERAKHAMRAERRAHGK
ncbi:MAG TPA: hypothetical protein VGN88_10850 [Phycisphaerae bacterium]|jgi:hypothetical protein